jgi:PPOX class probable FMN-dependent enzyme
VPFEHTITSVEELREHYFVNPTIDRKVIDHVDGGARSFIAASPFVVVATTSASGTDASPRGGPPGFVAVLDDHRIALGDLAGNRRLDTFENVLANPHVGMIFLIPGLGETMRINGRASLTTDPEVLAACAFEGFEPEVAFGVDVDEVYIHCAKALRRSRLWDQTTWPEPDDRPRPAQIIRDHVKYDVPAERIEADLEKNYVETLWEAGGIDPVADSRAAAETSAADDRS